MNNKAIIIGIVIVIILALGGWFIMSQNNQVTNTNVNTSISDTQLADTVNDNPNDLIGGDADAGTSAKTHEVTLTDTGYSPATLTIKKGDTVTFKNQSSGQVWTGSAMHPTHIVYNGTDVETHCPDIENDDFDQCKAEGPGTSWSFTFNKTGNWGYHNHMKSNQFGKIVVE